MLDPITHSIAYVVFQAMLSLFIISPFAGKTVEGDYFKIPPQELVRVLEQPRTAALRYYFTLEKKGKISAICLAVDSAGNENHSLVINKKSFKDAEKGIENYEAAGLVQQTGTKHGTIGLAYDTDGKIVITQGKAELLQLATSAHEIRAYYALKPENKHLVLVFAKVDVSGAVMMRAGQTREIELIDNSFECPPFCR